MAATKDPHLMTKSSCAGLRTLNTPKFMFRSGSVLISLSRFFVEKLEAVN